MSIPVFLLFQYQLIIIVVKKLIAEKNKKHDIIIYVIPKGVYYCFLISNIYKKIIVIYISNYQKTFLITKIFIIFSKISET